VTSATGRNPRRPPEGYSAEAVAAALVAVARRPRKEMTIGLEAKFFQTIWRIRPLDDLILGLVFRWYLSGREPARENPLWEAAGDGSPRGPRTMLSRPSLWAPIRTRIPWPPDRG
jgi:hypothetical protein